MQRILAWLGGIAFVLILLVVAAVFAYRAAVIPYLEGNIFVMHSQAVATPETLGVPYQTVKIDSHGRALQAWTVDGGVGTPAILVFHGNSQTVHDWATVQAYLFKQHVSSMVFDYSGFGNSTGKPTVQHLNQDAFAAWRAFAAWARARPKFVVAHSLGTAVALDNAPAFNPQPLGIAVYGAFSSARNLMGYLRAIPEWLVPFTPDLWDNVLAANRLREPLLVVAGMNDTNVPPEMGRQVALFAMAGDGGRFVLIPNADHDAMLAQHIDAVWTPILAFIRQRINGRSTLESAHKKSGSISNQRMPVPGSTASN